MRIPNNLYSGRLPFVTSLVLVLLIAYQLAQVTWTLLAPGDGPVVSAAGYGPAIERPDPGQVAARELFGTPGGETRDHAPVIDAPETGLNLTLKGVLAADDPGRARALIAGADGREQVYAPGATVPGGATLHEVQPDRVLLNRRGTLEALRLPRHTGDTSTSTRASAAPRVNNLQEVMPQDGDLTDIVRPQAVLVDGRLRGYRVYPGRDRQRFAALGLRAGDLVTAIDGVALNDPARSIEILQQLGESNQLTLTVERGGESEEIVVSLDR